MYRRFEFIVDYYFSLLLLRRKDYNKYKIKFLYTVLLIVKGCYNVHAKNLLDAFNSLNLLKGMGA
jgi:hypothetical protein